MSAAPPDLPRLRDSQTSRSDAYYLVHRRLFSELQRAASLAKGDLLDLGCGNKPYERLFRPYVASYTGCDLVQSSEHRVDILCPATDIPRPDASFDTVLCTQVIEHVANHQGLLREVFRLLRPAGLLILSGPMYWPLHEEPFDFFRFTEYGFQHLLREAGFGEVKIVPNGGKWAVCGQVLIHCLIGTVFQGVHATRLINGLFGFLDDRYPSRSDTLNYVVLARKS